ncbi:MAG: RibD family protein [Deltaproteobacteria bacterium]|nr:RibD family protein [Deltaproteobacteria bacterium]
MIVNKRQDVRVIMIAAITLCGRISPAPVGSGLDRRFLEKMRDESDASLMGCGTLRRDNPEMRGSGEGWRHRLRAFITASGHVPLREKAVFARGPAPLVFTGPNLVDTLGVLLAGKAEVLALPAGSGGLSIGGAIAELGRRGARSVLLEGGSLLNYHALRQRVVDEIMVTITPQLSGDENGATLADGPTPLGAPFLPLGLVSCRQEATGEIFARYQILYEDNHA